MRILLFLFIGLLSLNIGYTDTHRFGDADIKIKNIVFNEGSDEAEEEPDCE